MGKHVNIMAGISGSGKSTFAKQPMEGKPRRALVSSDTWFLKNGVYAFDPSQLSQAHAACLRAYLQHLQDDDMDLDCLWVDNTNCTSTEVAPYAALADAYGVPWQLIVVHVDFAKAVARNQHGVPAKVVWRQYQHLTNFLQHIPSWWLGHILYVKEEEGKFMLAVLKDGEWVVPA